MAIGVLTVQADAQEAIAGRTIPESFAPKPSKAPLAFVDLANFSGSEPPPGSEKMTFAPAGLKLIGDPVPLPEAAASLEAAFSPQRSTRTSVAELFLRANALERALADAGYVLYRVVIPPQVIVPGHPVLLQVISGSIDEIDASALDSHIRKPVEARLAPLLHLKPVRREQIERALLIAGDLGGISLRSTFAPGRSPGGTRLILDGTFRQWTGAVSVGRYASEAVGGWGLNTSLSANSPFGFGEQVYVAYQGDPQTALDLNARMRIAAAGAIVPLGTNGITISPEVLWSRMVPLPEPGVPDSENQMARASLRLNDPLIRTACRTLVAHAALDAISEEVMATDFDERVSANSYLAARGGVDAELLMLLSARLFGSLTLSQGLGNIQSPFNASGDVVSTQQNASAVFTKLNGMLGASNRWGRLGASAVVRAQTSFGEPLFDSEQLSLDGADAVSVLTPGTYSVDEGFTARAELQADVPRIPGFPGIVTPYVFAAYGAGRLNGVSEPIDPNLTAAGLGGGLRMELALPRLEDKPLNLQLELGHSWLSPNDTTANTRINFSAGWSF